MAVVALRPIVAAFSLSLSLLRRLSWQRWLRWALLALVTGAVIGLVGQWAERRELHNRIQALQQAAQSTVLGLGGIAGMRRHPAQLLL